jgi:Long-chain fatty acid transport protein
MKKNLITAALVAAITTPAFAGGLVTNTSQNAAFLRQSSQGAIIDITGLYMNPAGTAFLSEGWHLSLNSQTARQQRAIATDFPLFALNTAAPGQTEHRFTGNAFAPVIPSLQVSRNFEKWSLNASFALGGGGGKCEFDQGLGSFEALYAGTLYSQIPAMTKGQLTGYQLNSYMKGRSYQFGLTFGATYKLRENIAIFGGLRGVYATNNYNGWVEDISANAIVGGQSVSLNLNEYELALNTDQLGMGFTPVIGIDWRISNKWNVAAKYEFKTRLRLENKSEMNQFAQAQAATPGSVLGQFKDGAKVAQDIPSILVAGVQYSPFSFLRFMLTGSCYGDKSATRQKELGNTCELIAGFEWDICKLLTFSASLQNTTYDLKDSYMNDLSFNLSSNSVGTGFRINATKRCSIDIGYMHTFYKDRTVTTQTAAGDKTDRYHRTSRAFGFGVNLAF